MPTNSMDQAISREPGSSPAVESASPREIWPGFLRGNPELLLASITLAALLTAWLGGSVSGVLPPWAVLVLALIAYGVGGYGGTKEAIADALRGQLNIDFLMIAAALGAAFIGEWEEGALLLFLFTLSGALESFASGRTRQAIRGLAELRPETASVQRDNGVVALHVEALEVGDIVIVKPGERLPVDGAVLSGTTTVNQSPITGESIPVYKEPGDSVFSGTINGNGALEVQVTKLASDSTISKIIGLVEEAKNNAAPTQRFFDKFSQPYTLTVIGATVLALFVPIIAGGEPFESAFYRAMTLLVVASPCALIISTPASILSAIAAAARNGILFKGGAYLEQAARLDTMAFDKTGTLTYGKPALTDVVPLNSYSHDEVISLAAGAESLSEHPIAQAIMDRAIELNLPIEAPKEFRGLAGHGIQAVYERGARKEIIYIGNDKLFLDEKMELSPAIRMIGLQLQKQGKTAILVVRRSTVEGYSVPGRPDMAAGGSQLKEILGAPDRDWEVVGFLAVADAVREGALETIAALKKMGIGNIAMLTGDNRDVADAVAAEVGLHDVYAELLPEQKVEIVAKLVE